VSTIPEPAVDQGIVAALPSAREIRSRVGQRRLNVAVFVAAVTIYFAVGGLTGNVLAPGATALVVSLVGYPPVFVIAIIFVAIGGASIFFIRGVR
jgi:hypothetical protein